MNKYDNIYVNIWSISLYIFVIIACIPGQNALSFGSFPSITILFFILSLSASSSSFGVVSQGGIGNQGGGIGIPIVSYNEKITALETAITQMSTMIEMLKSQVTMATVNY